QPDLPPADQRAIWKLEVQLAIMLACVLVAIWFLYRVGKDLDRAVRNRVLSWLLVGLLLVGLVLAFRFGAHWLPLVAAGGWALLRRAFPLLLRAAPFAWSRWSERRHGQAGGAGEQARPTTGKSAMSRDEALQVLGLEEGASRAEILEAYKRLIKQVHPDRPGGSHYFAAKLNQAKAALLT